MFPKLFPPAHPVKDMTKAKQTPMIIELFIRNMIGLGTISLSSPLSRILYVQTKRAADIGTSGFLSGTGPP